MITHVNTVLIGKAIPGSYSTIDALNAGDVALFDENQKLIKTAEDADKAKALFVGVANGKIDVTMPEGSVAQKADIKFSNKITKDHPVSFNFGEYVAPVAEKITITLTGATIVAGHRYVVRIAYKDFGINSYQFTHTYEVFAADAVADNLANAIVKKINAHPNRRVKASASAAVITLTAMAVNDDNTVNSDNEYVFVNMEASLYKTTPGALLSNNPEAVPGATVVKTNGNPGKGYWKQVRDMERRNMGYTGLVQTGTRPAIEQDRMVEKGAEYDYITIENDNDFLSNDNQYIKNTPVVTNVFVKHNSGFDSSIVVAGIKKFLGIA